MNRFYLTVIALLTITVLILSTCNSCYRKQLDRLKNEPVMDKVRHDTIYEPQMVLVPAHAPIPEKEVVQLPSKIDTVYAVNDYYTYRYYSDTGTTKFGKFVQKDTVGENKIVGRSTEFLFNIPVVSNTITLTEKKRGQLYAGLIAQGNTKELLNGFGVGLTYKTKGDGLYDASILYGTNNSLNYQISKKWKISFRK